MPDNTHRTQDWLRLRQTGYLKIVDKPGEITITRHGNPAGLILFLLVALWAVFLFFFPKMSFSSILGQVIFMWPMTAVLGIGLYRNLQCAGLVRFLPDRIEFGGPLGGSLGYLKRDGMQQIKIESSEQQGMITSRFVSDVGYFSAFATKQSNTAVMRNNILIEAFHQPLHLDVVGADAPDLGFAPAAAEAAAPDLKFTPFTSGRR